jgi:hypothetical protein
MRQNVTCDLEMTTISSLIAKNKLIMTMSALYQTNTLSWIVTVVAHLFNRLWVEMSLDSAMLASQTTQSFFFFLNAAYIEKQQQIKIL